MRKFFSPLLFCFLLLSTTLIIHATTVNLSLTINKASCARLESFTISGSLSEDGQPVTDGLVAIQIENSNGDPMVLRTVNTEENPTYPDPINNPDFLGQVLNLYLSDANKNPVNNVNSGSIAYFTLTLQNLASDPQHIVAAVNVFDNDNIPVGITISEIGELAARSQSTILVSIPIPSSVASGRATVFASIYSDMPKDGGKPFSLEESSVFTINGIQGDAPPSSENGNQGNYDFTFNMPPRCPIGTYTIYACAAHSGVSDLRNIAFDVYQWGDLNDNGTVDFYDLLDFVSAYVDIRSPPDYTCNPLADFDNNGEINFQDILLFVSAYVQYWSIP